MVGKEQRMRILQIAPSVDPQKGGRERHVLKLARELADLDHHIAIITSDPNSALQNGALEVHTVSVMIIPGLPAIPSFRKFLRLMGQGFDLCHIHYHALFGEIAILASRARKIPVIVTIHAEIKRNILKSIYDRVTLIFTSCFSEKIICLSDSLKEGLIRRGLNPRKIIVVPHFIDLNAVKPNSMETWSSSYKSDILFVGRLEKRKGVLELLQILSYLSIRGIKYKAFIVGEGPLKKKVMAEISSHQLGDNVTYLGYVEEAVLRKLYDETKIVVIPSKYEGVPSVCLEAMCYGKVVVGFDIPGLRDILFDVDSSLVAKAFDIEEMAKKIIRLLNDPDQRLYIGNKSRENVKKYDVSVVTRELCNLYSEVSGQKKLSAR